MSLTIVSSGAEESLVWEMRKLTKCGLLLLSPRVPFVKIAGVNLHTLNVKDPIT